MSRVDLNAPNPASLLMAETWTLFNNGHQLAAVASARMLFESVLRNALDKRWRGKDRSGVVPLLETARLNRRISRSTARLVRDICGKLSEIMHGRPTDDTEIIESLLIAERQLRRLIQNLRNPSAVWEVSNV
jgi:hypothetical protein